MNDSGGIYWRSAPNWNTPEASSSNGFYPGTTGWMNEHFVNDGAPINQAAPGVPAYRCGGGEGGGVSVYFSPYDRGSHKLADQSTRTSYPSDWSENCGQNAYAQPHTVASDRPINTLSGWSLSRVGVDRYLAIATTAELQRLNYVLITDPGAYGELSNRSLQAGVYIAKWLHLNPGAHMVVISSSQISQEDNSRGIRESYYNDIRTASRPLQTDLRPQAMTCNYTDDHQTAFAAGQYWIQHQIGGVSCRTLQAGTAAFLPTGAWHP